MPPRTNSIRRSQAFIGKNIAAWMCLLTMLFGTTPRCTNAQAQATPDVAPLPDVDALSEVDESAAAAAGIRKVVGRHFTLYTDLPAAEEIDALPRVFDRAVAAWCDYFGIEPSAAAAWKVRGHLMRNRDAFRATGLWAADLPNFRHGFSRGNRIWWDEQPSEYYRRHLMLHEGTHAFMNAMLGGCGPGWYMEGMAEMLGTHRLVDDKVELGYFPARQQEVSRLGRIRLVQKSVATHGVKTIREVLRYDNRRYLENEAYAWCWALAKFLDTHPRCRERFRSLQEHVTDADLTERFLATFRDDWPALIEEWQVFAGELVHGHDIVRTAIDFSPGRRLNRGTATFQVESDRGWQSSGVALAAGQDFKLSAQGRYQLALDESGVEPVVWWCEPGGVTIRYHGDSPLGILQAAILPSTAMSDLGANATGAPSRPSRLLDPINVGISTTLTADISGTLYLRVNDSPGELGDNQGRLEVTVAAP